LGFGEAGYALRSPGACRRKHVDTAEADNDPGQHDFGESKSGANQSDTAVDDAIDVRLVYSDGSQRTRHLLAAYERGWDRDELPRLRLEGYQPDRHLH
jgi:hypothetical protein